MSKPLRTFYTHPQGKKAELQAMYEEWPFFQATIDLIEM